MANKRINDLPRATSTTIGDTLAIDGDTTRSITVENFLADKRPNLGVENVDNTSDADKPISDATQTALDLKANTDDLGTAAFVDASGLATSIQGAKADTAVQPEDVGTAAAEDVGTSAGNVVQLDGSAKLPAVDGSQLTNLPSGGTFIQAGTGAVTRTMQDKVREAVSITDFGANAANTPAVNTPLIQAAFDSGEAEIFIPNATFLSGLLIIPPTVHHIYGPGTLQLSGTVTGTNHFLYCPTHAGPLVIENITVSVDASTYPTRGAIVFNSCTNATVRDVKFPKSGQWAVAAFSCFDIHVEGCDIHRYGDSAVYFSTVNRGVISRNNVVNELVSAVSFPIRFEFGAEVFARENAVNLSNAGVFGICALETQRGGIIDNYVIGGMVEQIAAGRVIDFTVHGNVVFCTTGHHDFGMSFGGSAAVFNRNLSITSNVVINSGGSGICSSNFNVDTVIADNVVTNPGQFAPAGTVGTLHGNGIEIWPDNINTIVINNVVRNTALGLGKMQYGIREMTVAEILGISVSEPVGTYIDGNVAEDPTVGVVLLHAPSSFEGATTRKMSGGIVANYASGKGVVTSDGTLTARTVTQTATLANNAIMVLNATGAAPLGTIIITWGGGFSALFFLGGGGHSTTEALDPGAAFSVTAGTASSINIYWSATNSRYELENKKGVTAGFAVTYLGVF